MKILENHYVLAVPDDADAYYAELLAKGIETLSVPTDEPWGMREFAIRTSDGHRIKCGQVS